MKFDVTKAEHDYITDTSMSYRRLAGKYEVDQATISKYGRQNDWVNKRKEFQAKLKQKSLDLTSKRKAEGLSKLSDGTVKAIDIVVGRIDCITDDTSNKDIKAYVDMLEKLTDIHRNLTGSLTQQELNSFKIACERLEIEREKAGINEDDSESGIVFIPEIKEDTGCNVVIEGDADG